MPTYNADVMSSANCENDVNSNTEKHEAVKTNRDNNANAPEDNKSQAFKEKGANTSIGNNCTVLYNKNSETCKMRPPLNC